MGPRVAVLPGILLLALLGAADVAAGPRPLPVIAIEDAVGELSPALTLSSALGSTHPVLFGARLPIPNAPADSEEAARLDAHMAELARRNVAVWAAIRAPVSLEELEPWREYLRAFLTLHAERLMLLEVVMADQAPALQRFLLQVASTEGRAQREDLPVAVGGHDDLTAERLLESLEPDVAVYVDFVTLPETIAPARAAEAFANRGVSIGIAALASARPAADRASTVTIVRQTMMALATRVQTTAWRADVATLRAALSALTPAAHLLERAVVEIDPAAVGLRLEQAGDGSSKATVRHRLLFTPETFQTYMLYEGSPMLAGEGSPTRDVVHVELRLPANATPAIYDLLSGTRAPLEGFTRDPDSGVAQAQIALTGHPMLVAFSEGADRSYGERSGASADRSLSVQEIIARHQRQRVTQDSSVEHYVAHARMEQHFRPTLADPGYDVVTENRYFVDRSGAEWEELSFSVNGSKWGTDRPPFPLLQPEKVLSLPLDLRFDSDYQYRLAGTETLDGVPCYVVRFEPVRGDRALYRGTVWIDRESFARRRVQAVQTSTVPPVVSNEEIQNYDMVSTVDGRSAFLLTRLTARQILLVAGRNLLLEKSAVFSGFEVNSRTFTSERERARAGDRIMYRDTARGLRYLVKEGERRIVSERATAGVKAAAFGLRVDPSFGYPLPIFGINYIDFEFRGRPDTQFALLFGGVLAAGNLQRPKVAGTPFDASVEFFGIAAPGSDRLYGADGEREAERVLTWPLTTGANLGWQYSAFQKVQLQYQFRFDGYVRDRETAEDFVVPASTVTNGVGLGWEYRRGGYSLVLQGSWYARAGWQPWGNIHSGESSPERRYAKFNAHVGRSFFLDAVQKVHVNAAYFGGRHLDRFSRYQFGLFDDTKVHGVPASGLRFDDLGMARGAYSFNLFEQYRIDLFLEQAWGRDRTIDTAWHPLTGTGVALNVRAPWNTILQADFGKSFVSGRDSDLGSTVFQLMILKPLKK